MISIHAPRVGCDVYRRNHSDFLTDFNPRTPRGVRRVHVDKFHRAFQFQSTHPAWGATADKKPRAPKTSISIHAPRVGCDVSMGIFVFRIIVFQSTHPAWGATIYLSKF